MSFLFVKGTKGHGTRLKSKPLIKAGIAHNKDGVLLDHILPQSKAQQLRAYPLPLEFGFHRQRRQVQATDGRAVIRMGKGDIGDDLIDMDTHPLMHRLAILVQIFNELCFIGAPGECLVQHGRGLGILFRDEFAYLHGLNSGSKCNASKLAKGARYGRLMQKG